MTEATGTPSTPALANPTPEAEAVARLRGYVAEAEGYGQGAIMVATSDLRKALSTLPQAGEPSPEQPVAWRYRWKPMPRSIPGDWREPTHSRWSVQDQTGYEEQALYDHTAPTQPDAGALREALLRAKSVLEIYEDDEEVAAIEVALTGTQQAKGKE